MVERFPSFAVRISQIVLLCAVLLMLISFAYREPRQALGGEFAEYYIAGQMFLQAEPVYDLALHSSHYREMTHTDRRLPFVSGPFLLLLFGPLAMLPFPLAYAAWLVVSSTMFAAGIVLLAPAGKRRDALWLGFAFPTALIDAIIIGQIPTIAFSAFAAAIALERRRKPFWSGASLAVCVYKPSLLFWSVPFLLFTRRWRTVAGFASSVLALSLVSGIAFGRDLCIAWLRILIIWTRNTTTTVIYNFPTWKYVDLNAFRKLVLPEGTPSMVFTFAVAVALGGGLFWLWRHADCDVAWSATISATLVLNIYTPIYDCILVVAAVLVLYPHLRPVERLIIGLGLTACGWLAIPIGNVHTPPMTLAICLLFVFHIFVAQRGPAAAGRKALEAADAQV